LAVFDPWLSALLRFRNSLINSGQPVVGAAMFHRPLTRMGSRGRHDRGISIVHLGAGIRNDNTHENAALKVATLMNTHCHILGATVLSLTLELTKIAEEQSSKTSVWSM
jgi:hypothetical protein